MVLKSQTKAAQAKIDAMKKLKAEYNQAKEQGMVKSYVISPA